MHTNSVPPPARSQLWFWLLMGCRADIETCQSLGKIVMLSLGGAVGTYGFKSASQAETFATTLWDMFAEGYGSLRPFGDALIDGFDLGTYRIRSVLMVRY